MATKTISIDMEAYARLRAARLRPDESFSQVIKRGRWTQKRVSGKFLLEALSQAPLMSEEQLDYLERVQESDVAPVDRWNE